MLLETIKSLVSRSKKRKELSTTTQSLPNPIKTPAITIDPIQLPRNIRTDTKPEHTPNAQIRPDHEQLRTPPGADFFRYAHHFIISNPTMFTQVINSGGTVLQHLAQKRIVGAEVDSSARDPPPKCHPETRKSLRGRIVYWVLDVHRHWRMLWILGPAGAGKSAVAQTIAEEMKDSGRLGAALFFSRLNHRDDPDGVIPTLAHQLAIKCPEYKHIITERLADDPTLLEKNRRTQFKELIIDPFQTIMTHNTQLVQQPLLIIIDGLDECKSKEAQCEFIELISDHIRQVDKFPLLWMICSRPEWHLKGVLSQPDFQVTCKREELLIDDDEAQKDVMRVLQVGFQDIYRAYQDRLERGWPPKEHLRQISVTASGHFAFASTIVKFVGDIYRSDPQNQLIICIRFLGGLGTPGAVNPLHALDLLYRQIISDIPKDVLSNTMCILGLCLLYYGSPLTMRCQANFLLINQATFYRSLQQLHSVIEVPLAKDAHYRRLKFYHASFGDYLLDQRRSGPFSVNAPMVHSNIAIHALKWYSLSAKTRHTLPPTSPPNLEWVHHGHKQAIIRDLQNFSRRVVWETCCRVSDTISSSLIAELERFDFNGLSLERSMGRELPRFGDFLTWLYKLGEQNNSLIQLRQPATREDAGALRVHHTPHGSWFDYVSAFGVVPKGDTLHLRLGKGDKACDIVLEYDELPPLQDVSDSSDSKTSDSESSRSEY